MTNPPKPPTLAQQIAALDRIREQRKALAALQAEAEARELRARTAAREANLDNLVKGTPEAAAAAKAATDVLAAALSELGSIEQQATELEDADRRLAAAIEIKRAAARSAESAALVAALRARLPKMKKFLQEAALDFAVLAAAEGRRESVSETLRRNAADLDRVIQAHLAARRESILKEITDADPE